MATRKRGTRGRSRSGAATQANGLVLRRNNIDSQGGPMNSSINCVVARSSPDGKQWFNAFWNGRQMVYGQRRGVLTSARTLFRTLPPDQQAAKRRAIEEGFTAVGIA